MSSRLDRLRLFLTVTAASTLLCGLLYVTAQQLLRHSANDPQVQMAEDAAAALARGETPEPLRNRGAAAGQIDMARSLAPYLIDFDDALRPLASTVQLDGHIPVPPAGVFASAKARGENRLTWQPRRGVRSAVVVVPYAGLHPGYVLAGRSLRETERRVDQLGQLLRAGWAGLMVALLGFSVLLHLLAPAPTSVPAPGAVK